MAQKTVSRMIIGGSTGLRMMTALPHRAPPTRSIARAVVVVNSSMFARVPGPAERDAIDATISAYGTGVTRDTARTSGIVACRSEEHTSELQSRRDLVCRLLLEKKKKTMIVLQAVNRKYITT